MSANTQASSFSNGLASLTDVAEADSPFAIAYFDRFVAAALSLYVAILALLIWTMPITVDEAYTLHTIDGSLAHAFHQGVFFEMQAPLYFVLANIWSKISGSLEFVRLFSSLCCVATVPIAAGIFRRIFPETKTGWFAWLLITNPFFVLVGIEARAYALMLLIATLLLAFALRAADEDQQRFFDFAALAVLGIAGIYTHYFVGFALASIGGAIVLTSSRRTILIFAGTMLVVAVAITPVLSWLPNQVPTSAITNEELSPWRAFQLVAARFENYVFPIGFIADWLEARGITSETTWIARATLLLVLALTAAVGRPLARLLARPDYVRAVVFVGAAFVVFWIATVLLGPYIVEAHRYSIFVLVPIIVIMYGWATSASGRALAGWAMAISVLNLFIVVPDVDRHILGTDVQAVSQFISQHEEPNQPIFIYPSETALTFAHYYAGPNKILPLPHEAPLDRYDINQFVVSSERVVAGAVDRSGIQPNSTAWLIKKNVRSIVGVDCGLDHVESYFDKNFDIVRRYAFHRNTDVLFVKPKGARP